MEAHVNIGRGATLALQGAVLVYGGTGQAFCVWHEAKRIDTGHLMLAEATALTKDFVRLLTETMTPRFGAEILPANVLAKAEDTTVWWTPARVRPMFFRSGHDSGELSGKRFPQPALVWRIQGSDLSVRALAQNARPEAGRKLYVAPYFNTDGENGSVCQGSMRSPDEAGVGAMPLWEQAFFQSAFTHQSGSRKLTSHPGGFHGLWRSLAGKSRFPAKFLVPANETLLEFARRGN
ncbi:MAG: PRTRC system protein B [Bryobacteraceae bacterium]|nr:PRTRC system protein B [Bryobacteraceae bacterium]